MTKLQAALTASVLAVLLSGCGATPEQTVPEVASISQAPAASSSPASAQGPRARLDTTAAEQEKWARAYWQCMKDNGARVDDSEKAKLTGFVDPSQASPETFRACAAKKPNFVPEEMDPDLNPNYKQQWHKHVECLKAKGMPIVETDDGWSWKSSNVVIPPNADELERECQIEAFSAG
ncbi:hypothetical protein MRQ36_01990 [Micromonospora sp. R77]|uniref:hypothetical protein n=1 Tax=Micromonospora sp. R77 TaxID=2925836 RepID=UPI001F60AB0B|nr:hypothetical protein [Micromonospora sp. R77]MCI4061412.1 hypothetical protein [Micromonospora sp. R77]